jgi:hypothetical protein
MTEKLNEQNFRLLLEKKKDSIHFREINHHCPDICEGDNLTIHSRQERDGQLSLTNWFTGEKSHLVIRFCPSCGERIRAFPFDRNWSINTFNEEFEKYKQQIKEESAPIIHLNPFDLLKDDDAP